jgi:lipopolysaccharide/colanic/teichoic acid biosynthesis glycosyltransferase
MESLITLNRTMTNFQKSYIFSKRILDIFLSAVILAVTSPLFLLISLAIFIGSGWPIFFLQERVGWDRKVFNIIKFRTMRITSNAKGLLISSNNDSRVTGIGKFLRKYKLDELPQFINVLKGEMSIVGPRPEVKKYADSFFVDYDQILTVKPGITDYASILYRNEAKLLDAVFDKEKYYLEKILPIKIQLNKKYIDEASLITDLKIIFITILAIFK